MLIIHESELLINVVSHSPCYINAVAYYCATTLNLLLEDTSIHPDCRLAHHRKSDFWFFPSPSEKQKYRKIVTMNTRRDKFIWKRS